MDVGHPDEINELFDTISYEKGCSLIRMMNVFLTEEVFNTGINDYLNTYAYGNAFQVLDRPCSCRTFSPRYKSAFCSPLPSVRFRGVVVITSA